MIAAGASTRRHLLVHRHRWTWFGDEEAGPLDSQLRFQLVVRNYRPSFAFKKIQGQACNFACNIQLVSTFGSKLSGNGLILFWSVSVWVSSGGLFVVCGGMATSMQENGFETIRTVGVNQVKFLGWTITCNLFVTLEKGCGATTSQDPWPHSVATSGFLVDRWCFAIGGALCQGLRDCII